MIQGSTRAPLDPGLNPVFHPTSHYRKRLRAPHAIPEDSTCFSELHSLQGASTSSGEHHVTIRGGLQPLRRAPRTAGGSALPIPFALSPFETWRANAAIQPLKLGERLTSPGGAQLILASSIHSGGLQPLRRAPRDPGGALPLRRAPRASGGSTLKTSET